MNTNILFTDLQVVDPASDSTGATAMLVSDGNIVAIGLTAEVQNHPAAANSTHVSLNNQMVLPGFVDPHAHPLMYGQMMDWVDVGPSQVDDITQIIQVLKKVDSTLPAGVPLRAFGYEHRNLKEGRHPTKEDVDQISTTREIYIMNASGHGGVVNSIVLERNNISSATQDPAGGRFERDASGDPTGVIWDAACDILTGVNGVKLQDHAPNFHLPDSLEVLTKQFLQAEQDFLSHGTTTIGDAQVSMREFDVYKHAKNQKSTKARYVFLTTSALLPVAQNLREENFLDGDHMTANSIKLYADGTLGGWTAYFLKDTPQMQTALASFTIPLTITNDYF